jgi:decaprenylphospho-beta-D-erythro-pentofuranosid-2-ulose 2-reductase
LALVSAPVRTALVLGGGSDIGLAVVSELARHGLERAVLAARRPDEALAAAHAAAPGVEISAESWDALDVGAHRGLVDRAAERLEGIDVVVCAVGMLGHHAALTMPPDEVDVMVRTNFAGPAAALAAAADALVRQGRGTIVVLSSVAGQRARRSNYVYGSSKAGLDVFAQGLGDAVAGTGVRVVVVPPGFVVSRMTTGFDPAPFATDPDTVARRTVDAVLRARAEVVHVPPLLGPVFAALRAAPRPLWRRIAGDR